MELFSHISVFISKMPDQTTLCCSFNIWSISTHECNFSIQHLPAWMTIKTPLQREFTRLVMFADKLSSRLWRLLRAGGSRTGTWPSVSFPAISSRQRVRCTPHSSRWQHLTYVDVFFTQFLQTLQQHARSQSWLSHSANSGFLTSHNRDCRLHRTGTLGPTPSTVGLFQQIMHNTCRAKISIFTGCSRKIWWWKSQNLYVIVCELVVRSILWGNNYPQILHIPTCKLSVNYPFIVLLLRTYRESRAKSQSRNIRSSVTEPMRKLWVSTL